MFFAVFYCHLRAWKRLGHRGAISEALFFGSVKIEKCNFVICNVLTPLKKVEKLIEYVSTLLSK